MLYQSDEEGDLYRDNDDSEATESDSEEGLRAQQDAEDFPLGRRGLDSTMLERFGEAEEGGTERTVARHLILREISKSVQPDVVSSPTGKRRKGKEHEETSRKKKSRTVSSKHCSTTAKKDAAPTPSRVTKKVTRYDNITGEPTKEFLAKNHNVWKVRKIQRNKQKRGQEILDSVASLDQYVIESFLYSEHHFEMERFRDGPAGSFQKELVHRWMMAHPEKRLEYLNDEDQVREYVPNETDWNTLPWNRPSEWFLDVSKLIEDDRLCIVQMLYEVTLDPYKQLIESLPFTAGEKKAREGTA